MAHAQSSGEIASSGRTRTLAIDVGGTGLKASIVDEAGRLLTDRARIDTPVGAPPKEIVQALVQLVQPLGPYDRVSVGFPGVVREGRVLTAPNLGNKGWKGFDLAGALGKGLGKPVRVANDADVQGLAVIAGKGVEMVITLGTGFGSALFMDGELAPHLEIAHLPFRKGKTYEQRTGDKARRKLGKKDWNREVRKAIAALRVLTHFDRLYIGGGNADKLKIKLDPDVQIVSNENGVRGGAKLWRER